MFESLFNESGLSLERLRTFSEIVEAGGITTAAGGDPNRQSQYSRQLKELERSFGVELLTRGRRGSHPTEAGRRLHKLVLHAFNSLGEFRESCANLPVQLTLGAGESLIQWLILPRMGKLTTAQPPITLSLLNQRTSEILANVNSGALDFGIVGRLEGEPALRSTRIGSLDFRLFVPKSLLPARRKNLTPRVLDGMPLAILDSSLGIKEALDEAGQNFKFRPDIRFRFSSYPQLAQAVSCLKVAAIMPAFAAEVLTAKEVAEIRFPFLDDLTRELRLVWHRKAAEIRPNLATYAKLLASELKG